MENLKKMLFIAMVLGATLTSCSKESFVAEDEVELFSTGGDDEKVKATPS